MVEKKKKIYFNKFYMFTLHYENNSFIISSFLKNTYLHFQNRSVIENNVPPTVAPIKKFD